MENKVFNASSYDTPEGLASAIESRVIQAVAKQANMSVSQLSRDSTLKNLALDSLDQVELVMSLEDSFDTTMSDETVSAFVTVDDIIRHIQAEVVKKNNLK